MQFIEDSVVPPDALGRYLEGVAALLQEADFEAAVSGDDAAWRLPLDQPEAWLPPGEQAEPDPDDEDEGLPAVRNLGTRPRHS